MISKRSPSKHDEQENVKTTVWCWQILIFEESSPSHHKKLKYGIFHSLRPICKSYRILAITQNVSLLRNLFKIPGKGSRMLKHFSKHSLIEGEFFSFIESSKTCRTLVMEFSFITALCGRKSLHSWLDFKWFYHIFMNPFGQYWFIRF